MVRFKSPSRILKRARAMDGARPFRALCARGPVGGDVPRALLTIRDVPLEGGRRRWECLGCPARAGDWACETAVEMLHHVVQHDQAMEPQRVVPYTVLVELAAQALYDEGFRGEWE